eukprot:1252216-Pyramimonas_sp.AAC.1
MPCTRRHIPSVARSASLWGRLRRKKAVVSSKNRPMKAVASGAGSKSRVIGCSSSRTKGHSYSMHIRLDSGGLQGLPIGIPFL